MIKMDEQQLKSYIAGFCDGDGSICIGKCTRGFQLKLEFTQCNKEFLNKINELFQTDGHIYTDSRSEKYISENASSLRFCGLKALPFLNIVKDYGIIKAKQAELGIEFSSLINKQNIHEMKLEYYNKMKSHNADKKSYEKDYNRINNAYIAGLFDAEGNVYLNLIKNKYYVKITQRSDPLLLENIKKFLGYGNISKSENDRLRFHSKINIKKFYNDVIPFCLIKADELSKLVLHLNG